MKLWLFEDISPSKIDIYRLTTNGKKLFPSSPRKRQNAAAKRQQRIANLAARAEESQRKR